MENIILWVIIVILSAAVAVLLYVVRTPRPGNMAKRTLPQQPPSAAAQQDTFQLNPYQSRLTSGDTFHLQLEILRQSLSLTTAVLLWAGLEEKDIQILSLSSRRDDTVHAPFPRGSGFTGGLRPDCPEIAISAIPKHLSIPFYSERQNGGSLLAMHIPLSLSSQEIAASDLPPLAILVLHRDEESAWPEHERELVRLTCRKLSQDLLISHNMEQTTRDRQAIQLICQGLQELNQVLGLQSVLDASIKTVKQLVNADFVAISLIDNNEHCIVKADGHNAGAIEGLSFPRQEGLVGQAIKLKRWLPAHARYEGAAPIFSSQLWTIDFQSLLILPLLTEDNEPIGALTVAGKQNGLFSRQLRELLQVIAGQVTTKIELGRAHEKIYQLATTDGLTGLSNHRTFQHAFDNMLYRAQRQNNPLTMVLCDIDHFKQVNDTYGHPFGDAVLQEVARVLSGTIRKVDLASRYGGEEFALLLEDSDISGGRIQAERVRTAIESLTFNHQGKEVQISMSFGLASFPQDGDKKGNLIELADQALYQAKTSGRNRSVCWCDMKQSS